jgi:hypothetical protein
MVRLVRIHSNPSSTNLTLYLSSAIIC